MTERIISRRDFVRGVAGVVVVALTADACSLLLPPDEASPNPSKTPNLSPNPATLEPVTTPTPTHSPKPSPTPEPTPKPTPKPRSEQWIKYQGEQVVWNGDENKRNVYLTMDDGWNPSNMESALRIANDNGIKMTFCPVGKLIARNAGMYKEIVSEGHDIQNHTFTHSRLDTHSKAQIKDEVLKARDALWNAVGFEYPQGFLRPPGEFGVTGRTIYKPLFDATMELGYRVLVWDVSSAGTSYGATSATEKQVAQIEKNVEGHMHNGAISLQHAINVDVTAFPDIVSYVKRNGWKPITIRQGLGQ